MRAAYPFFLAELRKLGFVEGRNLLVEFRLAGHGVPQAFTAANELVAWKADVLYAFGAELALQAAAAARPPVPIVVGAANFDPIAKGYVQSLARPGGNVTGIVARWPELVVKQIELLQEAFPDRNRLGVLWDTQSADQFSAAEREAKARRLTLHPLKLENPPYNFDSAFRALAQDGAQMLIVASSPSFAQQNAQIASLAIEHRLPAMFILKHYVEAGGLMSYGVDFAPLMRRAASFVAKILRGAKPADLPVEQVSNFEFVVNLKTAKAIGVALPTSILLRADEVIE
jgi:putative ABC transport system substrate-binding protein